MNLADILNADDEDMPLNCPGRESFNDIENASSFHTPDSQLQRARQSHIHYSHIPENLPERRNLFGCQQETKVDAESDEEMKMNGIEEVRNDLLSPMSVLMMRYATPEIESQGARRQRVRNRAQARYRQRRRQGQRHRLEGVEQSDAGELRRLQRRSRRRGKAAICQDDFDPNVVNGEKDVVDGRHRLPQMTSNCGLCGALKWEFESQAKCCSNGRVRLFPVKPPPPALLRLFVEDSDFRRQIRPYNNAFAFTSLGASRYSNANIDERVAGSCAVYSFRVQGALCHRMGALLPAENTAKPAFAQIYIVDPDASERIKKRLGIFGGLNISHLQLIEAIMEECNPYAKEFLNAGQIIRRHQQQLRAARQLQNLPDNDGVEARVDVELVLRNVPGDDPRTHNLPTISEVAALLIQDGSEHNPRDIRLTTRGNALFTIFETNPAYDPLQYPLLFPYGEPGWTYTEKYAPTTRQYSRDKMSLREFVAFRLHEKRHVSEQSGLLHLGGRLFQQYVVDQWAKAEQERLRWFLANQAEIRADQYIGVRDALDQRDVMEPTSGSDFSNMMKVGTRLILPATFTGGDRYMYQQYQDSMAIVREFGTPDMFITMTCNPNWPEIQENIQPHQSAQDRPDIVSRVWQQKLDSFLHDIDEGVLGVMVAKVHVIEYQKRGLPHVHLLLIVASEDKPKTPEAINRLVSAELPDPLKHPQLYDTVLTTMMHGPCGDKYPSSVCMKDGKCSKKFPKPLNPVTKTNDGFPLYMRRRREESSELLTKANRVWVNATANQWVVPHNPYLCQKYDSHINVEVCTSVTAVKYIYKYVYKGPDKATVTLQNRPGGSRPSREPNEILRYLSARYISPVEACQRLFDCPIQGKSHSVVALPVHLPGQNNVTWGPNTNMNSLIEHGAKTKLTEFFNLCSSDDMAANMVYKDVPKKFRWDAREKKWCRYKKFVPSIGRMIHCSPQDLERFYLRMMLCYRKRPTSYEDLLTVDGHTYSSFHDAAMAAGYLDNDNEWELCMTEASQFKMPYELRQLFATILVFSLPNHIQTLWLHFKKALSEDYQRVHHSGENDRRVIFATLLSLSQLLSANGKDLTSFPQLPQLQDFPDLYQQSRATNELILQERSYNPNELRAVMARASQMNPDQQVIYDQVRDALTSTSIPGRQHLFFVDGPGGTGKSFLLEQILASIRIEGKIALSVASSGIAALLLTGGRTAHSTFKIPLKLTAESTCSIKAQSKRAQLLIACDAIIWDEAPMTHRFAYEALDRTMRDLMEVNQPFGGKVVILSGDFRQVLPIVRDGSIGDSIDASVKKSSLWSYFRQLQLKINMRVLTATDPAAAHHASKWASDLLTIGEGRHDVCDQLGDDYIKIPPELLVDVRHNEETVRDERNGDVDLSLDGIVDTLYGSINEAHDNDAYFAERAILTTRNLDVHRINEEVTCRISGEAREYFSVDTVVGDSDEEQLLYEAEFLNAQNCSGIPPHKLTLKIGTPIMMMRNLNSDLGLCNGTRLRVKEMGDNCIQATIMTGMRYGQKVIIPRIALISDDVKLPVQFKRKQFPVIPSFGMTINKAQGQTIRSLGLYLPTPVFTHGQLYVAMSRVSSPNNIRVVVDDPECVDGHVFTKNIVYRQLLNE